MIYEHEKFGYANFHYIKTKKFKTTRISVKFHRKLKRSEATKRALLSQMVLGGTKSYPTQKDMSRHLEELYGASLSSSVIKKGTASVLSYTLSMPNEKFINEPVLEEGLKLLNEVIFKPNLKNEKVFEKEKRELRQYIESIVENKMKYSINELLERMGESEPFSVNIDGYLLDIDSILIDEIIKYHDEVVLSDTVDVFVVGDLSEGQKALIEAYLQFTKRTPHFDVVHKMYVGKPVRKFTEQQDIRQAKLNIGYRVDTTITDPDYYAMYVANGILGGFAHSKLFMNVREKESLAYFCGSRFDSYNGIMIIYSGIETKNYEKAYEIINEQIDALKGGNFTDLEFTQTKAMIENGMYESFDAAGGVVNFYFNSAVTQRDISLENWISGINNVTREEVIKAANKIKEDTIFFLHGGEVDEN
jgi:predicted Zn-dependent peptidase